MTPDDTATQPGHPTSATQGFLILTGLIVSTVGVIYLATVYWPNLSEWGRLLVLLFLTTGYGALAAYLDGVGLNQPILNLSGLRWLTIPTALFVLTGVGALTTAIFFVNMEALGREVKIAVAILIGLGLIAAGAWLGQRKAAA